MTEREQALQDIHRGMELLWRGINTLDRLGLPPPATTLGLLAGPVSPKPQEEAHGTSIGQHQ